MMVRMVKMADESVYSMMRRQPCRECKRSSSTQRLRIWPIEDEGAVEMSDGHHMFVDEASHTHGTEWLESVGAMKWK